MKEQVDPYEFTEESLTDRGYKDLFYALKKCGDRSWETNKSRKKVPVLKHPTDPSCSRLDFIHLYDFIFRQIKQNELDPFDFQKEFVAAPVEWETFRQGRYRNISPDKVGVGICTAAKFLNTPIIFFVTQLFEHCEVNNIRLTSYQTFEQKIQSLFRDAETIVSQQASKSPLPHSHENSSFPVAQISTQNIQPSPVQLTGMSVQERIELDKAIEEIKKEAGFLKYDKNLTGKRYPAKIEGGLQKVDQLLAVAPDEIKLLTLKVHLLLVLKRPDEAFYISEDLYSGDSANIYAAMAHMSVLISLERLDEALAIARELRQHHPNSFILAVKTGSILERLGKYEEAITENKRALSINGDNALTYVNIALIYLDKLKNYKASERFFKLAYQKVPENEHIAFYYLVSLSMQQKKEEVLAFTREFVEKGINGTKTTYMHALLKIEEERYDEAIKIVNKQLEDPEFDLFESIEDKSLMYFLMGIAFNEKYYKNTENSHAYMYAKDCYLESLKYNTERPATYEYLAELSLVAGETGEAIEYLSKASNLYHLSQDHGMEWEAYIRVSDRVKKSNPEAEYFLPLEWCSENYADNIDCAIQLAYFYIDEGNAKDASLWIDKAVVLPGNNSGNKYSAQEKADLRYRLGILLLKYLNDLKNEKAYAENAIEQFDLCLDCLDKSKDMERWLEAMCSKGRALYRLGLSNKDIAVLKSAILFMEDLIKDCPRIENHKQFILILDAYAQMSDDFLMQEESEENLHRYVASKKALIESIKFNDFGNGLYTQMFEAARKFADIGNQYSNVKLIFDAIEYFEYLIEKFKSDLTQNERTATNMAYAEACVDLYLKSNDESAFDKADFVLSSLMLQDAYSKNTKLLTIFGDLYGINGNEHQDILKIEKSLDAYNAALQLLNKDDCPDDYAHILYQKGLLLHKIGFDKPDNNSLRKSVESLQKSLCYDQIKSNPWSAYVANHECGRGLLQLYHSGNSINDLKEAKQHLQNAISLVSLKEHEINYVDSHYYLGDTLFLIGNHNEDEENLKDAIQSYKECLKAKSTHENTEFLNDINDKISHAKSLLKTE